MDFLAIEVAVGLTFAYLVFSLAASRINEYVATLLQWRAAGLERGLRAMLDRPAPEPQRPDTGAGGEPPTAESGSTGYRPTLSAAAIKQQPKVAAMEAALEKGRRISYLPPKTFADTLFDLLAPSAATLLGGITVAGRPEAQQALAAISRSPSEDTVRELTGTLPPDDPNQPLVSELHDAVTRDPLDRIRTALADLPEDHPARQPLLGLLDDAQGDRDRFLAAVATWFDDQMERLSGWYKRRVQRWILGYGLALTILFNVDTVGMAQTLWRAPTERAAVAAIAGAAAGRDITAVNTSLDSVHKLPLPLGWTAPHAGNQISDDPRHLPATPAQWLLKLLGLTITVAALSFGAPFWFDVLGKVARMRNTGDKPKPAA